MNLEAEPINTYCDICYKATPFRNVKGEPNMRPYFFYFELGEDEWIESCPECEKKNPFKVFGSRLVNGTATQKLKNKRALNHALNRVRGIK